MKQAGEVTEGDFLLTSSGLEKVSSISRVMRQGRAAPLTMTGDLLVDGVLSSNYAHAPSHSVAHLWMSPFRWLDLLTDEETEGEVQMSFLNKNCLLNEIAKKIWEITTDRQKKCLKVRQALGT